MLPDYDAVIFDEAHTLEDVAADHLGILVSQGGVEYVLTSFSPRERTRASSRLSAMATRSRSSKHTRQAAERFFAAVYQWHTSQPRGTGRVREPGIVPDILSEELTKLANQLHDCARDRDSEEERLELTSRGDRLDGMAALREGMAASNRSTARSTGSKCGRVASRECRSPALRSRSGRR